MKRIIILLCMLLIALNNSYCMELTTGGTSKKDAKLKTDLTCEVCKVLKHQIVEKIDLLDKDINTIKLIACPLVAENSTMSISDCYAIVDLYEPPIFMSLMRLLLANEDLICGALMQVCDSPDLSIFDLKGWIANVLKNAPTKSTKKVATGKNGTYTILQVNDMHFDLNYHEGGESFCHNNLICCRKDSKTPIGKHKTPAGRFGMVSNCDLPERTIDDFFHFLNDKIKPDVIMWLGDNEFHEIERVSKEINIDTSTRLSKKFQNALSGTNMDIWLSIGNHESFPIDQFDHMTSKSQWLLDGLSDAYRPLLGDQVASQVKAKGYYARRIPDRNLKILSLFGAPYDSLNFYNIMKTFDPLGQLAWLTRELSKSENIDEDVFIMAHIPLGGDFTVAVWNDAFNAILDRYQNTIKAMFTAHTHDDHVKFHTSHKDPNKVIAVDFIAPSLTTYSVHNPSFRVYKIDSETNQVLDYDQYRLNLEIWNQQPASEKAQWDKVYTWSELYGYDSANMKNIQNWRDKMTEGDEEFMKKFWENKTAQYKKITEVKPEQIAYGKCDILGDARLRLKCFKEAGIPIPLELEIGNLMDFYLTKH